MKNIALFFILVSLIFDANSQHVCRHADANASPREHSVDIIKMVLDVNFEPEKGIVHGKVVHTFKALRPSIDTLFFDAPGITILSAKLDGKDLEYYTNAIGVIVKFNNKPKWDETHSITFEYDAKPKKGIYFIGWNHYDASQKRTKTRRQIWTQGQGIDNRHWIPMYDNMNDKFITETNVLFDKNFKVLSNGVLKSEKNSSINTKSWSYAMSKPHAGYLLMLAIDEYAVKKSKTTTSVPVQFWYYPEHSEKVEPTSIHTEKIIEFLERETGVKYPWEQYSQVMVQDFMYGAMENTTATIFGDFFNTDARSFFDRNYISVNAHELTHQWFGDLITARSAADIWLQESFATYYPKQFFKYLDGEDKYQWLCRLDMNTALKAAESDNIPVRNSSAGTARVYQKGSVVIDMLRYVLGDEPLKRVITHYLNEHAYKNVESNDLNQAIQDVLGISMDWFFEQWIYKGGEPHYKISYDKQDKKIKLKVEQIHEMTSLIGLFKMPVNIEIGLKNGDMIKKQIWVQQASEDFYFENTNNEDIAYIIFDVNNKILKKTTFSKTNDMWLNQAKSATNMIDRYDAWIALAQVAYADKKEILEKAFQTETFYGIRNELIKQMMADANGQQLVKSRLAEEHTETIKFFMNQNQNIPSGFTEIYESWLEHPSYEVVIGSMQRLFENEPKNSMTYLNKISNIDGQNNNVKMKYLELMMAITQKDEYINQLVSFTSPQYEFRTRVSAFETLKKLNICNDVVLKNGFESLGSFNGRLSGPIKSVLDYFGTQIQYKAMMKSVYNNMSDETLKKIVKSNFGFL